MMSAIEFEFPKTCQALKVLQQQFNCSSCGKFAQSPCTLGGCEHIFCNVCCEVYLDHNECPVCNIHVNVKDAQVNRQVFNLARLCQRLEAVLTDQDDESTSKHDEHCEGKITADDESNYTCRKTKNQFKVVNDEKQNDEDQKRKMKGDKKRNCVKKQIKEKDVESDNEGLNKGKVLKSGLRQRKRRSLPENQRTMTQMLYPESDEEMEIDEEEESINSTPVVKKQIGKKNGKKGKKTRSNMAENSMDQTTMSQFFEYVDDSDEGGSLTCHHDNKKNIENQVGSSEPDQKKTKSAKNPSKVRSTSRNLRTRTTEIKLDSSLINTPSSSKEPKRRHSFGPGTSRVQELIEEHTEHFTEKKAKRGLSPRKRRNSGSKVHLNTSLTGSGKKNVDPLMKRNAKGETPLQVAAIKGDISKVKELLTAGVTPNTRDNAGWTPLHEAVHYGHTDIARMLLDHGAMINIPGTDNDTPLHDALRHDKLDCVKLLVSRGACITSRNINGHTPEDFAVTDEMKAALSTHRTSTVIRPTEQVDVLEYQQPCLLPTALSREQKITLQKCAAVIKGRVVEDFCPEVTHVITTSNQDGMCARTFKYMHGVLNGKWIVNFDWLDMCIEYGSKVCEEAFEIPGSSQNIESHAAEKGRLNRKNQLPKLFDGYQFYFQGNFEYPTPDKEELIELVKSGGGQVLTREPKLEHTCEIPTVPYHAPTSGPLCKCYIFVVHDNNSKTEPIQTERICSVSVAWILDCIGMFRIQPFIEF